jgi:hypothetical protein
MGQIGASPKITIPLDVGEWFFQKREEETGKKKKSEN